MRRPVLLLLKFVYFYALSMGLVHFSYDWRACRARFKRSTTIYTVLANFVIVSSLYGISNTQVFKLAEERAVHLYQYLSIAAALIRFSGVIMSLIVNWRRRWLYLAVVNDFAQLRERYFCGMPLQRATLLHFERCIVQKFCSGLSSEFLLWVATMWAVREDYNWQLFLGILMITLVTHLLNLIITIYYFVVVCVNMHFQILNDELARILQRAHLMVQQQRGRKRAGCFLTQCCQLADELDELALAHAELQAIATRINNILDIQGMCVIINIYLNNISIMYEVYKVTELRAYFFDAGAVHLALVAIAFASYYWDLKVFLSGLIEMLELYAESAILLRRYVALQGLDVRLEQSFSRFAMQMILNPLQYNMGGFFTFSKSMAFSVFGSAISHSVILMQYDYKNS